ncbi:hypothetical protein [Streptomyces coeruleorubidus]
MRRASVAKADVGHGFRTAFRWADVAADTLVFCATHTGLTPPEGQPDKTGHG